MENRSRYNDFLGRVGRVLRRAPSYGAPEHLAERIMSRVSAEAAPGLGWGLRPALACSGVMAALLLASLQGPERALAPNSTLPNIVSFTIDKTDIQPSESITLHWKVVNANKVVIEHPRSAVIQSRQDDSLTFSMQTPGTFKFILVAMSEKGTIRTALEANP